MENILVIGNGFFAQNYEGYERGNTSLGGVTVHHASRHPIAHVNKNSYFVDMLEHGSIVGLLEQMEPDVIVDCAAILGRNGDKDKLPQNTTMASNLLDSVHAVGISPRVVLLGSSSVYGAVTEDELPVSEAMPMHPAETDLYGRSKKEESEVARRLADSYGIRLVEARIFNPIGPGMNATNFIARVVEQAYAIQTSRQANRLIEVRNLSAERDYSHVTDIVRGISVIAHAADSDLHHDVYNIGSGERTSNRQLVDLVLMHTGLDVPAIATDTAYEPLVGAVQADNSRLRDLGWRPYYTLDQAIDATVTCLGMAA